MGSCRSGGMAHQFLHSPHPWRCTSRRGAGDLDRTGIWLGCVGIVKPINNGEAVSAGKRRGWPFARASDCHVQAADAIFQNFPMRLESQGIAPAKQSGRMVAHRNLSLSY